MALQYENPGYVTIKAYHIVMWYGDAYHMMYARCYSMCYATSHCLNCIFTCYLANTFIYKWAAIDSVGACRLTLYARDIINNIKKTSPLTADTFKDAQTWWNIQINASVHHTGPVWTSDGRRLNHTGSKNQTFTNKINRKTKNMVQTKQFK